MDEDEVVVVDLMEPERCRVCGGEPASRIYGSIACGSCKVFFIRVTTAGAKVAECQNDRKCHRQNFRGAGKSKCVSCRYEKCIKVGMIPEMTARRRGCTLRERRSLVGLRKKGRKVLQDGPDQQMPSTSSAPDSREVQLAAKKFRKPIICLQDVSVETINTLVKFEEMIMNDDPSFSVMVNFDFSLNESIAEVLQNPLLVCPRVPLGMHPSTGDIPVQFLPTLGARIFTRSLVLFADWCRAIPEFWQIDQEDRAILFARQLLRQNMVKNFYYTYKYKYEGVLFTFGNRIKLRQLQSEGTFSESSSLFNLHLAVGLGQILPIMTRVEMGDEELVLLKNIILFSSGLGLTEKTGEIARRAFNKYSGILLEFLKFRHKNEAMAIDRYMALMEIPKHLQNMTPKAGSLFGKALLLKEGSLAGPLSEELLWKL